MTKYEREDLLLDALWQAKELLESLKELGGHDEDIAAVADIKSVLEIEHAEVADLLWERAQKSDDGIMREYYGGLL